MRPRNDRAFSDFYEQTLAPLVRYDAAHKTQLVHSLQALLEHNGNITRAAASLFLHRNSLLCRLERIRQIPGRDLNDADDRLALHVAMKVRT
jgi:purine catabolism regulator